MATRIEHPGRITNREDRLREIARILDTTATNDFAYNHPIKQHLRQAADMLRIQATSISTWVPSGEKE